MPTTFKCDFDYTTTYVGCPVEVSADPSFRDRTYGVVINPKNNGADIVVYLADGAQVMLYDCMHLGDSRITERPEIFAQGDRGVFCLTRSELALRKIAEHTDTLVKLTEMNDLGDVLKGLGDRLVRLEEMFGKRAARKPRRTQKDMARELAEAPA